MFLICLFLFLFNMDCMHVLMFLKATSVHIPNNQILQFNFMCFFF